MTAKQIQRSLTVPAFRRWLKEQSPDHSFYYYDNRNCAIAQFAKETFGLSEVWVGGYELKLTKTSPDIAFSERFQEVSRNIGGLGSPHTVAQILEVIG